MTAQRVGSYEIVRMLARGGMAVVYLVRQPALDREVVLKRLDLESDDATLAQRFVHEARLAAALDHPNIVTLFDFFEDDGVAYIAMEYVGGGSLRSLVGRAALPQVFGVLEGVLAGLEHAEHHGIAHRDLKPENVLITRRGGVKIADFGIARAYNALTPQRLTSTGMTMGTPTYMAPEQAANEALGPYTDLYALGVIAFELLAGRPPFESETALSVLYAHVHTPPPRLQELVPSIPAPVGEWVDRLLAKDPSQRPGSAAGAREALEEIAVAELGPYWRRSSAVTPPSGAPAAAANGDGELPTTLEAEHEPTAPQTPTPPAATAIAPAGPARSRHRVRLVAAATALLGAAAGAFLIATAGHAPRRAARAVPPATRAATPFDFDGDRRQELVIAMLRASPHGSRIKSGVVLVHRATRRSGWTLVKESSAGLRGRPRRGDDFGSGLASADFDRDGWTDLAIGTPGRERVSVLYGSPRRLLGGRRQQLAGKDMRLPAGAGHYGYGVLGRDLNGDGYAELVVAAPGRDPGQPGTGAMQILFGGRDGLSASTSRIIRRPGMGFAGFGRRMRAGDVDGDGHVDLVEGAPTWPTAPGHGTFCHGGARGPTRCSEFGASSGTSGLAIADVNNDGRDDIVQGDGFPQPALGLAPRGGEVRLWLGSHRGPRGSPIVLTQDSEYVPGTDEPGDEFGALTEAGDLDADGFADMIVGAPGEDERAGRITVIRGARDGYATTGHSWFDQGSNAVAGSPEPGAEFGSTVTVLLLSADDRPDVAVAARGEHTANERVTVFKGGTGVFAPDETSTSLLPGVAGLVHAPRGGRIRLARASGA